MTKSMLKIANKLINIIMNNKNKNTLVTTNRKTYFFQLYFDIHFNLKSMNSCKRFENEEMKKLCAVSPKMNSQTT